jgi:hypothetical protein
MTDHLSALLDDETIVTEQSHVNVGGMERTLSVVAGAILLGGGLRHLRSVSGLLGGAIGAGLLVRGLTGHCSVYQALGLNTACEQRSKTSAEMPTDETERSGAFDEVEEASAESFPASDPPAWTATAATKNQAR